MPIIKRNKPLSIRDRTGLLTHFHNVSSQCGEDGILGYIFGKSGPLSQDEQECRKRYVVEVGSWDGLHLSNSHNLLCGNAHETYGAGNKWHGILIEGDEEKSKAAEAVHKDRLNRVQLLTAMVSIDGPSNLHNILLRQCPHLPPSFDLLSIDLDGIDYFVWESLLPPFRPTVVVIEFNPTIPNHILYIQDRDENVRHGSSLAALIELACEKGYQLVETTLYNAIFVTNEVFPLFHGHIPISNTIDTLHEVSMGTDIWQLYDGSLGKHQRISHYTSTCHLYV